MTKQEFNDYLVSIGGLVRTYREEKGPILDSGWFAIDEGWYELVKNLIDELIAIGWDKRINQIKEKFGGLRFYVEAVPTGGDEIITKYENLSYITCEKCGQPSVLRTGGWMASLCDEHADGREKVTK